MMTNDQLTIAMEAVRDQILAVVRDHENTCHGGNICWGNRASIVAFVAHAVGARGDVWDYAKQVREEMDRDCPGCPAEHGEAPDQPLPPKES